MAINPNYSVIDFNTNIQNINEGSAQGPGSVIMTNLYTKGEYIAEYDNLKNQNINYKKDINYSTYLIKYVNNIKNKKNSITPQYNEANEKRKLEINNYYILKYKKESDILKQLIFFCGLALIGCIVFMKGFISESFYIIYLAFIFAIGLIKILYSIYNLYSRDTVHFDETDFSYSSIAGTDISNNKINTDKDKDKDKNKDNTNTNDYKCI